MASANEPWLLVILIVSVLSSSTKTCGVTEALVAFVDASVVDEIACVTCYSNKGETKVRRAPAPCKTTIGNLWALMGKRYVTLIDDAELFPSNSFLPSNFWDTPGFKGVDLPRELIDSIECW